MSERVKLKEKSSSPQRGCFPFMLENGDTQGGEGEGGRPAPFPDWARDSWQSDNENAHKCSCFLNTN